MVDTSAAHRGQIRPHFPEENIPDERAGHKLVPARRLLDAVLWILNTGPQWRMLLRSYPSDKTLHRRFRPWARQEILLDFANDLREHDPLDTSACYIDAMFANGCGGCLKVGNKKCGEVVKIMPIVDRIGLPFSVRTHAENDYEVIFCAVAF